MKFFLFSGGSETFEANAGLGPHRDGHRSIGVLYFSRMGYNESPGDEERKVLLLL